MSTSFKKKTTSRGRPPLPNGVKPSPNNNQLLVSTGIPSLDLLIGGGLPVGTLLLIEEDVYGSYASIMQKLFLAEGAVCNHHMYVASNRRKPKEILKEIPTCITDITSVDKKSETVNNNVPDDLKIAWRYQNIPKSSPVAIPSTQLGHYFDISNTLDESKICELECTFFEAKEINEENLSNAHSIYNELLGSIKCTSEKYIPSSSMCLSTVLRISLQSLHSPLWASNFSSIDAYDSSLMRFLLNLRSILRSSFTCCVVTIPTHLIEDHGFVNRIHHCCDFVVRLESFEGSKQEHNPVYKEYHGLFHIVKVARLNSIGGQNVDTSDLAFKLKRKKFMIEKLHLPPDFSETVSRSQVNTSNINNGSPLCSQTTPVNNILEF